MTQGKEWVKVEVEDTGKGLNIVVADLYLSSNFFFAEPSEVV